MKSSTRNIITGALMLAMFLAAIEVTIVNAAMPTVVGALGGVSLYSWVFSAFMLANTTSVPIYGKLADLYGRKNVFIIAVSLFITGSVLCGLSQSMGQLVLFRAIQGLGAGGVLPVALTIVGDIFPFEQRARMQGWFSSMWGLAAILGPFVGGWTVEHFSWRWLFWFNFPLGLGIILIIFLFLPNRRHKKSDTSIDYLGAILLSFGVFGLLYSTLLIGQGMRENLLAIAVFLFALLLLILFIRWEQKIEHPFLPIHLFRKPIIAASNLTAFLTGMGMFGAISFVPLFVQGVLGKSPTLAGLAITPQVLGWSAMSVIAGRWLLKKGYRPPILTGVSLIVVAAGLFIWMDTSTPYWLVLLSMLVLGGGLGLSMTSFLIAVQNAVDTNQRGSSTSSQMFSRSMGGAFGVSILGAVMSFRLDREVEAYIRTHRDQLTPEMIQHLQTAKGLSSPESLAILPSGMEKTMSQFLSSALGTTFLTAALFSLIALVTAFFLVPAGSAQSLSAEEKE